MPSDLEVFSQRLGANLEVGALGSALLPTWPQFPHRLQGPFQLWFTPESRGSWGRMGVEITSAGSSFVGVAQPGGEGSQKVDVPGRSSPSRASISFFGGGGQEAKLPAPSPRLGS